ncbi:hypothetical protein [Nocardia aobensis]|uniref:hypothetical protein n=1 Tax=Nocardia aobensis TaxID=257277 RepID=UPI000316E454|nr:hypothetical protein [Nocardia aobensis]
MLIGILVFWSVVSALWLSRWSVTGWERRAVVIGDLAVAVGLMAATRLVADYPWYHGTAPNGNSGFHATGSTDERIGRRGGRPG